MDDARARPTVLGIVLAGGRSSRMGADKAFVELAGRPLIAHAIERLAPQVDALAISANGEGARFCAFAAPVLGDAPADRGAGPLAGIAAALAYARGHGHGLIATAPCDAPFAPRDWVARLRAALTQSDAPIVAIEGPRGLEPLFALWRADLAAPLEAFLSAGGRATREFLKERNAARLPWAAQGGLDPFANLNRPDELAAARIP